MALIKREGRRKCEYLFTSLTVEGQFNSRSMQRPICQQWRPLSCKTAERLGYYLRDRVICVFIFFEHDVSLIFGLYHPNEDGNFRPSSAVRILNGPAPPYQRINASHRKRLENNPTHSVLTVSSTLLTEGGSGKSGGGETLKFAEIQDLVTLAGGFVWSSATFQSELFIRIRRFFRPYFLIADSQMLKKTIKYPFIHYIHDACDLFIASFVVDTFRYFGRNVYVLWSQADIFLELRILVPSLITYTK
ncbi:hypothetical protein ACTXT7_003626 [Hymenolepis weldensis]